MVLNKIEKLIEKYENGETTLQEEQQLKHYFTKETVAPHLEVYKPMFVYFSITQNEQFTKDVPLEPKKTIVLYKWISVAAIAIVMLGVYLSGAFDRQLTPSDLQGEDLIAYNQAMEAFNLLSSNFKKGTDNLSAVNQLSESFTKGEENMALLTQFDKTTDKVFKYE
ncbi:MAG: hypothetical protein KJO77_07750 [Bacteroidia bacterium]|nr:hypothetical protein [Bacteroidia bacterium]NND51330.1 hypothetical protein [Flavobacteriaceae bacterium]